MTYRNYDDLNWCDFCSQTFHIDELIRVNSIGEVYCTHCLKKAHEELDALFETAKENNT